MVARTVVLKTAPRQTLLASWAWPFLAFSLLFAISAPARCQETSPEEPSSEAIVDAARNARQQKANSAKPAKVFTTDELSPEIPAAPPSAPATSTSRTATLSAAKPGEPASTEASCQNPEDEEKLKAELQGAQEQREQLRRELGPQAPVISGGNLDTSNFKPGNSGFNMGSPPLSQSQPQAPGRLEGVALDERIASLERAVRLSCESPKVAEVQRNLDAVEHELSLAQRQFDLNRAAYYSQPNYAGNTTGKANLDAEQQQIQTLQEQVEQLKQKLAEEQPSPRTP